jgi:hypothetical protein
MAIRAAAPATSLSPVATVPATIPSSSATKVGRRAMRAFQLAASKSFSRS